VVFVALLGLTIVTVAISYLHLPRPTAIALGLAVATVKASMVAAVFMHLISERKVILYLLGLTVFCALVVLLLPILTSPGGVANV
jgi:cytochrome c oxidase subunit IV